MGFHLGVLATAYGKRGQHLADDRTGRRRAADDFDRQRRVHQSKADPAGVLGHQQSAQPKAHQGGPALGVEVSITVGKRVQPAHRKRLG